MRTIKIAIIQQNNYYEDQTSGYNEATLIITHAATQGIELAVLPELSGCGYIPNQSVWQYAEQADGRTAQWACALSSQLKIYIGAGFIETDGNDFYNSYLISGPNGKVCGIIRKEDAESYCFKRSRGSTYVETGIGRIGIGICADNHNIDRLRRMKNSNVDFMLMPHASPAPYKTNSRISEKDKMLFEKQPYMVASVYSKYLRVPTIYVNAIGSYPKFLGGLLVKDFNESFRLMGGSLVTGSDGKTIMKMGNEDYCAIADVTLDKSTYPPFKPSIYHGKWLHPGNSIFRYVIIPIVNKIAIRSYNKEHKKLIKAFQEGQDDHAKKTIRIEKTGIN